MKITSGGVELQHLEKSSLYSKGIRNNLSPPQLAIPIFSFSTVLLMLNMVFLSYQ